MSITCPACKITTDKLKEAISPRKDGDYQIRGECPNCGRWIKWVGYADSELVKLAIHQMFIRSQNAL